MGSVNTDFCNLQIVNEERAYIVGLWCADGYHRTIWQADSTAMVRSLRIFIAIVASSMGI